MSRYITVAATLSLLLASACSSPLVALAVSKISGPPASPAVKPDPAAPQILVTLPSRGTSFKMALLDKDGDVSIWAAENGSQLFLRNGVLIGTRGLGRDVMSASVPKMADILAMKPHSRTYFDLDGTDTTIRYDFTCAVTVAPPGADLPGTKHLIEACVHPSGTLLNEFWLKPTGVAQKSSQWVTTGVGYAVIEPQ